ncbi:MAG: 3-dehydroquinate synthase [Nitrospira sp. SB0662_bin_26]|nr:3-dehydroquinate synthase [Nitrospira sp. SB0662_bin_26]
MTRSHEIVKVGLGKRSYDIVIAPGSLHRMGKYLHALGLSGKVGVVTNPTLAGLYGASLKQALVKAGFTCHVISIPEGERTKTLRWASFIIDELVAHRFERRSALVALGGGVIGDITGFAASMYLRGIPFIQVATTLVAQVDSSVGGKTGVNHPSGKNLIGAFYQPALVVSDTNTLRTLPRREWVAGLAEVIKYGVISDRKFFAFLEDRMEHILDMRETDVQTVVKRCCEIKAKVVGKDERESGLRRILNYGHTIGHALESLSRYRKYIHGEAVGIGMVHEALLAHHLKLCSPSVVDRQRTLIQRTGLPVRMPAHSFLKFWGAMGHDKKVAGGTIHCVLPRLIGHVQVMPLDPRAVRRWYALLG